MVLLLESHVLMPILCSKCRGWPVPREWKMRVAVWGGHEGRGRGWVGKKRTAYAWFCYVYFSLCRGQNSSDFSEDGPPLIYPQSCVFAVAVGGPSAPALDVLSGGQVREHPQG